jgi:hypothetical protein
MRRLRSSRHLITLLALAIPAAAALGATPKPGWEIEHTVANGALSGIDTAKHCGARRFGTYTIRDAEIYKRGKLAGKTVRVVITFALLDDRRRHTFHFVSVSGTAVASMSPLVRRTLEHALAAQYPKYSIEVLDVLPGGRLKTRMWLNGKVLSTGDVGLQQTRC